MRLRVATTLDVSAVPSSEVMTVSAKARRNSAANVKPSAGVWYMYVRVCRERTAMSGFYDIACSRADGADDLLGALRGKVTLAVNVASRCGLTPQYAGLEQLQRELSAERFTVVGFPCNQFGAQEPGSEAQIAAFCQTSYQVTFPLSAKLDVNGAHRHPVYAFLTSPGTGIAGDISWNFAKFL